MQPNSEQLKAAEEKEFIRKAIRKIRKTPDVLFSSDPKVKSHEEKLTDLFASLLAEREAKAKQEVKDFVLSQCRLSDSDRQALKDL